MPIYMAGSNVLLHVILNAVKNLLFRTIQGDVSRKAQHDGIFLEMFTYLHVSLNAVKNPQFRTTHEDVSQKTQHDGIFLVTFTYLHVILETV
jgi:hypothetical protein